MDGGLFLHAYKTGRQDITDIVLKVALNTINQTNPSESTSKFTASLYCQDKYFNY